LHRSRYARPVPRQGVGAAVTDIRQTSSASGSRCQNAQPSTALRLHGDYRPVRTARARSRTAMKVSAGLTGACPGWAFDAAGHSGALVCMCRAFAAAGSRERMIRRPMRHEIVAFSRAAMPAWVECPPFCPSICTSTVAHRRQPRCLKGYWRYLKRCRGIGKGDACQPSTSDGFVGSRNRAACRSLPANGSHPSPPLM
jgi:hypothetical protein